MQKFVKRAAVLVMCLVMLLSMAACGENGSTGVTSGQPAGSGNVADYGTVWSAPSTVKIDQNDTAYANKGEAKLTFNTVKNEYESHQLLISAIKDVNAYYLESSDLKCGENVLSKENITVYNERYVTVAEAAYGSFTHPDALIPIDAAMTYGELKIAANQNAALWVTVYVPAQTPAGVYEGTFKLTVENGSMDIPVQVTVNDYTLPETTSGQTLFSWRYNRVAPGELDGSIEMMETYYEFFLDYRVSLQSLPLESQTSEEIIDTLVKYYDRLTTYTIQPEPGTVPGGGTVAEKSKEMIYAIASISGPEKNYFEKAMLYVVDEPVLSDPSKREYTLSMIGHVNNMLQSCVDTIEADTTGIFNNFKQIENWQDSILNIPNIIPITADAADWLLKNVDAEIGAQVIDALNTICPTFDVFSDQYADKLVALCEEQGIENIWWYGCTGPRAPYGNYHIGDKNLLAARTYSWVQAKYGIEGNLYWDAAAYTDENPLYPDQYINVYEQPFRRTDSSWPAGDGFLAYPGAAYGIYGPLPSMRLMSLRDGMEELEMLLALEKQYEGLEAQYGEGFSAKSSIASLVDMVSYNGSALYADGESGFDFDQLRASLINSIVWNNQGIGFVLEKVSVEGSVANISYYVAEGCSIYIDGQLQEPVSGCRYEYVLDLEQSDSLNVEIETADNVRYKLKRFISRPSTILQNFNDASVLSHITVTEGGTAELSEEYATEGSAAHICVVGKITGNELVDAAYVPSFTVSTAALNGISNLSEVNIMNMDLYNSGEEACKVTIKIYSGTSYISAGEFTLNSGENALTLSISDLKFSGLSSADRIVFEFNNSTDGVTANTYDIYLDNMIAKD